MTTTFLAIGVILNSILLMRQGARIARLERERMDKATLDREQRETHYLRERGP